ncbi:MAG TPA: barstar family protein [Alphaproteobacteria bacterium]|nr:barstar family protein [Alphaproteobacteria bacterium]
MQEIEIDAQDWKTLEDYASALRAALRSPAWHGSSIDAFIDSMVYGDINEINSPYKIIVKNTKNLPTWILEELEYLKKCLLEHNPHDEEIILFEIEP